jgi:hypothetical protein
MSNIDIDVNISSVLAERNKALSNLDMEWARRNMQGASSDHVRLLAMHKARYECTSIAAELRHLSAKWLRDRGYLRMYRMELLPEGELPG